MQWLKEIPSHWEIEPFGRHFSYGKGLPITKADLTPEGVAVISYGQVHSKLNTGSSISRDLVRYVSSVYLESHPQCLLVKGDFVFADTSEDIEGSGNFAFNDFAEKIFAGYHTVVVRPKDLSFPRYYAYLFQSLNWKGQIQSLVNGVKVYSINKGHLKKTYLLIPPLAEQEQIVSYLEDKTSKIDAYVADKEKEILLLQELKQKTIADAITKGLNPDVKTKDSGISWIGEIPEHWEVKRVGSFLRERKEKYNGDNTLGILSLLKGLGIIPYEEKGNIGNKAKEDLSTYKIARKGDVVVNCMNVIIGSSGITDYDGYISPAYYSFIPVDRMMAIIYKHWLSLPQMQGAIRCMAKGILEIRLRVSSQQLLSMKIPFPPLDEQRAIVSYIEEKCQKIDSLTTELQSEIDYLKEYKQRLIADCVTGQVNVQKEVT
ncbi:MAG: restriction endonuclease subunit S [Bacteroidaceae bacterium]|nr:restriction endonuclease subunit S [Prevotellaceae bacterium]MDD7526279.1 restriction endonuclease subunit S [Prevotellaceae bacterium]MDY5759689.1 restriction endonuclease subunit S [Bacteroidaceae bacterium]